MDKYFVKGGQSLYGCVEIGSAKNAVLPILAASVLCDGIVRLENTPQYRDVQNMIHILENFGAKTNLNAKTLTLDMTGLKHYDLPQKLSSQVRSSIFCLGALLGRFKKARVAYPGGCDIGSRPIDLHLKGLECLNVKIIDRHGYITCDGSAMQCGIVHLDFPSVGATENIMMAAATIKGTTKIINSAKEPEIVDLQNFLNACGAKISGAGTSVIVVHGVKKLSGTNFTPSADRIIAGTYILAGIICGGEIIIKNCPNRNLSALFSKLSPKTVKLSYKKNCLILKSSGKHPAISKIETMPYPGFPTDLQPQMVAMLATAKGASMITENLFETRFKYTQELCKMGAKICCSGKTAYIIGVPKLYGAEVFSNDLRGGAALTISALMADGYTTISNVGQIERGYDHLVEDLTSLGANIKKISF